jgi:hypothetical protein
MLVACANVPQDKRSDNECSVPCTPLRYVTDATLWFASVMAIYDFGEFADGVMINPASDTAPLCRF